MARHPLAAVSSFQPAPPTTAPGAADYAGRIVKIGYWGLLLLTFALPFDLARRPLFWSSELSITNLSVLLIAVAVVAALTVAMVSLQALRGSRDAATYFSRRRIPLGILLGYLVSSTLSWTLATSSTQGFTWILGVVVGALLWLALPVWLADDMESKVARLGIALVAGAIVAGIVGFIEVLGGTAIEQDFSVFRFGPDTMGPFLRLSATFSSANVAAMYFELAFPFAIAGLIGTARGLSRHWVPFAAWLAAVDVLLVAILLTYSRGALLGLAAAALAMIAAGRSKWRSLAMPPWKAPAVVALNLALLAGILSAHSSSLALLRFSTANDRAWYQASFSSRVSKTLLAGSTRVIAVTVENRTPLTWNGSSFRTYGVGYHWLYPSWKVARFENNVTWLTSDLPPGGRQTVRAKIVTPQAPGRYLLVWDVVWKGATWFAPKTGNYQTAPVDVTRPRELAGLTGSTIRGPPPDIANLPTAPALDRRQIWEVAVKMLERRPLFGTGPQGVRMNYAAFSSPGASPNARVGPPHAHNVVLEILADWGLIGGALFFALLTVLLWPAVVRVWRGSVRHSWELAVIGAVAALAGHEVVDYFLNKQSIFVFLWLLCGLAALMTREAGPHLDVKRRAQGRP